MGKFGAGRLAGRATHVTDCSVLMNFDDLPTERTSLSIPSTGVALFADEGVQSLILHHFVSCQTATLLAALVATLHALRSLGCGRSAVVIVAFPQVPEDEPRKR